MALPRRGAGARRAPAPGLRPGVVLSAALHLGLAALAVLASLRRERPPEPLPPPAFAVEFETGAPERPAEPESNPPSGALEEPAPSDAAEEEAPPPPLAAVEPPVPEQARTPPEQPAPPRPEDAQVAESDLPHPEGQPIPPPPPAAPQPQRQAALTPPLPRPPRPVPPPPEPLPGLLMPDARGFLQPPPRPAGPRRGLDLSPGRIPQSGRDSPEAQVLVKGAKVGPDWRNAFRRWLEEHGRYPANAAVVGEQGTTRIELIVDPDGRVRSGRLVQRSGSVWLDAGTVSLFRNAVLPPFPPGADPSGVTVDLTINYVLIRR